MILCCAQSGEAQQHKMSKTWIVNSNKEASKLSSAQDGWNLAGKEATRTTRTRHGGNGHPDLNWRARELDAAAAAADSDSSYSYETDSTGTVEESYYSSENEMIEKPPTNRVILEVEALAKSIEANSICPKCSSRLTFLFDTVCLATSFSLKCLNARCPYIHHGDAPSKANLQVRNFAFDRRERNTDYAINILYVLGFLSVGDGPVEAGRLCGLLGLPRDTSMERRSYPIIEERLAPAVLELGKEVLGENLAAEVSLANAKKTNALDENDLMLWRQSQDPQANFVLSKNKYPMINASSSRIIRKNRKRVNTLPKQKNKITIITSR